MDPADDADAEGEEVEALSSLGTKRHPQSAKSAPLWQ